MKTLHSGIILGLFFTSIGYMVGAFLPELFFWKVQTSNLWLDNLFNSIQILSAALILSALKQKRE